MRKIKVYIKIGDSKRGYKISASTKPDRKPFQKAPGYYFRGPKTYLPTIYFALNINLPDEAFRDAIRTIGEINYKLKDIGIAAELSQITKE